MGKKGMEVKCVYKSGILKKEGKGCVVCVRKFTREIGVKSKRRA